MDGHELGGVADPDHQCDRIRHRNDRLHRRLQQRAVANCDAHSDWRRDLYGGTARAGGDLPVLVLSEQRKCKRVRCHRVYGVDDIGGLRVAAASNASWLTITSGTSGSGSGTVSYSVAANSGSTSRFANITAGGTSFNVEQSGITATTTPPPSSLQAAVNGNSVQLTWTAPVGATPTGYVIDAGTAPGLSNLTTQATGSTATVFNAGAPNGTYYLRVRALYPTGTSSASNEVTVVVGCTSPPQSPTGLNVQLAGSQLTLTWIRPASTVTQFLLEAGSGPGRTDLASVPIPGSQGTFNASAPAGTYYVRIRASNACGTSRPSGEIFFTVGTGVALPGAPAGLSASVVNRNVRLTWTAPTGSITGYLLEAGTSAGLANLVSFVVGTTPVFDTTNVPPGTYYVRVRAITAAGTGAPTADVAVIVP